MTGTPKGAEFQVVPNSSQAVPPMTNDTRIELLKAEYLHIQTAVVAYDSQILTIKAWGMAASLTGVGVAFTARSEHLLLLAAVCSLVFWICESYWRAFQHAFYPRLEELEHYFAGSAPDIVPMQTWVAWRARHRQLPLLERIRLLFSAPVLLPHAFIFLAGSGMCAAGHVGLLTLFPIPAR